MNNQICTSFDPHLFVCVCIIPVYEAVLIIFKDQKLGTQVNVLILTLKIKTHEVDLNTWAKVKQR